GLTDAPGGEPGEGERAEESLQQVEEDGLAVGRGADAAASNRQGVSGRVARRIRKRDRRLGLLALAPAARQPERLTRDQASERPDGERRQADRDSLSPALAGEPALALSQQLRHGGGC